MSELPFLTDLLLVVGVGVLAALAVSALRLPAVTGFMVAGTLVGPAGLGLVQDTPGIIAIAEIGVVLLLFSVGLEFSLSRLKRIGRLVAIGGSLQVGLTVLATTGIAVLLGFNGIEGLFYGFMVALSSTAIVLRGLADRSETDAPHGRFVIGVLLFQDLTVIPMMLLLPVLAGEATTSPALGILGALAQATAMVAVTFVLGRVVVPRLFARVDSLKSRELFLLSVLAVCIGVSWVTAAAGLSLALGAFLAGMMLAESEYAQRALGQVLPLRDALASLFFVSLGMLFDVRAFVDHPFIVVSLFLLIFLGKGAIATLACLAMRFPARVAILSGVGLAQFGEFGFILARSGAELGLLRADVGPPLMAACLLTMLVTPFAMRLAPRLAAGAALLRPLERLLGARGVIEAEAQGGPRDHVVIAGSGVAGRLLSQALSHRGVPYLLIDVNAESVRASLARGEPAYHGDVTSEDTLQHVQLERARAFVILINDQDATRRAVAAATALAPRTPVFVRAQYLLEARALAKYGQVDVVSEEFEAGVEVLARVLRRLELPMNVIRDEVRLARQQAQESARPHTLPRRALGEIPELAELKVESVEVRPAAEAEGRSSADLQLRSRSGALVVAVRRDGRLMGDERELRFAAGDVVYLVGEKDSIRRAAVIFGAGEQARPD